MTRPEETAGTLDSRAEGGSTSHDVAAGLVVLVFGIAVALYARTFPPMPGQNIGPSFFPTVVGTLMVLLGATLAVPALGRGARTRRIAEEEPGRSPRMALNFVAVIAVLLFYAIAVDRLGFFLTGTMFLAALLLVFGVRRSWILPLSLGVPVALHYGFYTVLRVPLPWGLLDAIAW